MTRVSDDTPDAAPADGPPAAAEPAPVPVQTVPAEAANSPERDGQFAAPTPIWLLDVDGVLNAVTHVPDERVWRDYRSGFATAASRRWPITWSPTVVRAVRRVHETRAAEVLWLTTWDDHANGDLADLLGLPRLPLAGRALETRAEAPHGWWKLQVARRIHEQDPDRPLLWTDDDLSYDAEAAEWISSRGLGISPHTACGLEPAHLEDIAAFVGHDVSTWG